MNAIGTFCFPTEQLTTTDRPQSPEIDPRSIETVDYIDPQKLARILALAEEVDE